jgi:hypothetical protein
VCIASCAVSVRRPTSERLKVIVQEKSRAEIFFLEDSKSPTRQSQPAAAGRRESPRAMVDYSSAPPACSKAWASCKTRSSPKAGP